MMFRSRACAISGLFALSVWAAGGAQAQLGPAPAPQDGMLSPAPLGAPPSAFITPAPAAPAAA
ncbi:MAG: hypothetical protein JWN93_2093, partial [Hyphomicrobiales bacterium]|nr:hypothetical protein [Hyphomicrobiales bacterium]